MPIYLDHAATTPLHPDVFEAMKPYYLEHFGNPSSIHAFGRKNRAAVDQARSVIAVAINAKPSEIVFTSGGTEADNTALIGAAFANRNRGNHIITTAIEHHAVLHTCAYLESQGFSVTYLPVDAHGRVSVSDVAAALTDQTILISVMYGNNEVGTLQPIEEIGTLAREKDIYFHTDAVQAIGALPVDVQILPVDMLAITAHKFNGPKGIGALYVRSGVKLLPHLHGGAQERSRRAGTENVAAIVGFARAMEIAADGIFKKRQAMLTLRETMLGIWQREGISFHVNGHSEHFLPHILNVSFPGTETEVLLMNMDIAGIAVSSGSACTAGSFQLSHVLQAMNLPQAQLQSALRFSFGYGTTMEDATMAAEATASIVERLVK